MNTHRFFRTGLIFALVILFYSFALSAFSQTKGDIPNLKNRGALYYLGEQDELLIKVNIWGFVQKPGQYMVPNGTDLISLISFAGGPREQARLKNIKIIRNRALLASRMEPNEGHLAMNGKFELNAGESGDEGLQKSKDQFGDQRKVIEVNVKKYIDTGDESLIPDLEPGDTVIVEGSAFHFISKAFEFTTKLAVIAQIYFWIYAARR